MPPRKLDASVPDVGKNVEVRTETEVGAVTWTSELVTAVDGEWFTAGNGRNAKRMHVSWGGKVWREARGAEPLGGVHREGVNRIEFADADGQACAIQQADDVLRLTAVSLKRGPHGAGFAQLVANWAAGRDFRDNG